MGEVINMSRLYFPNLNGLRFIAAFVVIIHHIEQIKSIFGYANHWDNPAVKVIGKLGVILFFVLSGFLITYLLLTEKNKTGDINTSNFYKRRILRIWPLYYIIMTLGLFALPTFEFFNIPVFTETISQHFAYKVLLFTFFLPNLALKLYEPIPYAAQSWSVGVEEQFYLLWPVILRKFKNIFVLLLCVIIIHMMVKIGLICLQSNTDSEAFQIATKFWYSFSIDCMAIGGIAAYALFYKNELALKIVFNKNIQILAYTLTIILISFGFNKPLYGYEVYAVLFAVIIINLAGNTKSIIRIENKVFNYLGKVSYGLYMYHPLAIIVSLKVLTSLDIYNNYSIFCIGILATIAISSLSYELIEKKFIRSKTKYSLIISGDNAKSDTYESSDQLSTVKIGK